MAPLGLLADAIIATNPLIIVPTDDVASRHLHRLHDRERRHGRPDSPICALIERSIGAPEGFPIVEARAAVMALAEEERVRVPKTQVVATFAELSKWLTRAGLPTVLKADGTSGGTGVRIVQTLEEAAKAFRELRTAPPSPRTRLQNLLRQGKALVWPPLLRHRTVVNAQAYVTGCDAISEVACWKGTVLASLQFEVLSKQYTGGPASVLRAIDNAEMSLAIKKVVRRLELSGLHGFDFILDEQTGNAHLIEMNPRATQVGHLTLGPGRDLPAALYAAASGMPLRTAPKITENDTIALFPQEWIRNRASAFLESGYHDVPWEQPELVRACVLSCPEPRVRPSQHEEWIRELTAVRVPRP
ncbi:MAG: ATP-grasp domain-containing protein [Candidatus Acidiferrales bacterium]